ncbi:hypothetical protein BJ170DRAFT_622824 [Xylariales sp. AK1849]|nr:hypothetical protein BJ170DRAFT_622824 [Xylariales sp. AK1849]
MALTSSISSHHYVTSAKRAAVKKAERNNARKMEKQELELGQYNERRVNPFLCKQEAHLRPAVEDDLDGIAQIYNQEVTKGWRAVDEKPVTVAQWRGIIQNCRKEQMPFIVALSGYRNPYVRLEDTHHPVIGFAYLDISSRGVAGSTASIGKHSARLYVMVDSEYRRRKVGTALLDRIFIAASISYLEKEDSYQWINPAQIPACFKPLHNPREYRTLLIEVYVKNLGIKEETAKGEEYQVIWNFLERDFNMYLGCHTSNFTYASNHDPPILLDRLVFEHMCRGAD